MVNLKFYCLSSLPSLRLQLVSECFVSTIHVSFLLTAAVFLFLHIITVSRVRLQVPSFLSITSLFRLQFPSKSQHTLFPITAERLSLSACVCVCGVGVGWGGGGGVRACMRACVRACVSFHSSVHVFTLLAFCSAALLRRSLFPDSFLSASSCVLRGFLFLPAAPLLLISLLVLKISILSSCWDW